MRYLRLLHLFSVIHVSGNAAVASLESAPGTRVNRDFRGDNSSLSPLAMVASQIVLPEGLTCHRRR